MGEVTTILEDLLGEGHFLNALAAGALILGVLFAGRRLGFGRLRGWLLAYAVAALLILIVGFSLDASLWWRLLLVVGAGALVDFIDSSQRLRTMAFLRVVTWALLAASVLSFTSAVTTESEGWLVVFLPMWAIALGLGMRWLDRSTLADVLGPLLAVTIAGVWVTVPETDMVEVIVGLAPSLGLVTLPPVRSRATTSGCLVMACLLGWLIVDGGTGRAIPIVGGLASAGVLALGLIFGIRRFARSGLLVFTVHLFYVVIATRVVDWLESMSAVLIALGLLTVAASVALLVLSSRVDVDEQPSQVGAERLS